MNDDTYYRSRFRVRERVYLLVEHGFQRGWMILRVGKTGHPDRAAGPMVAYLIGDGKVTTEVTAYDLLEDPKNGRRFSSMLLRKMLLEMMPELP